MSLFSGAEECFGHFDEVGGVAGTGSFVRRVHRKLGKADVHGAHGDAGSAFLQIFLKVPDDTASVVYF